jgi:lipopolysaccharide heptosyltransferase II
MSTSRLLLLAPLPLGDTLFVTPAIHALRVRYPNAHLSVVALPGNAPLLAHNPDLDVLRAMQWGRALPGLLLDLREQRFDAAISFGAATLGWLTNAVGIADHYTQDVPRWWWLLPGRCDGVYRRQHAVDLFARAARQFDLPPVEHRLVASLTMSERQTIRHVLAQRRLLDGAPIVALHPGSGAVPCHKRWPLAGFAEVARRLVHDDGAHVVVVGGSDEAPLGQMLQLQAGRGVHNLVGQLNVRQCLALLECCTLFAGNDSGPLHMAAAVGTPVVGLYGPTDPRVYGPCAPAGRAAVLRPPRPRVSRHFVGGAPLWARSIFPERWDASLAAVRAEQVLTAARALMRSESMPTPVSR